MLEQITN